eukprot:gnl/MRDRNA2_/MRDRNA2_23920_c0_seq1.p1 gnl/MRDRNA2_/MRDRNA2_23920_c0~~gnl/MRDRNA2_/MRDRNA2_23920_c0_seq1.p1  ORF type:complete len:557 (+),score=92.76 gnl/MRDRNA2_/MRDRNA2_23920_c0_seq1:43-1713(+)
MKKYKNKQGPLEHSAVSRLNGVLCEKAYTTTAALQLLERFLQEAGTEAKEESDPESEVDIEEIDIDSLPVVDESQVIPTAGSDQELEEVMSHFFRAFSAATGGKLDDAASALVLRYCRWDDGDALRKWRHDPHALCQSAGVSCCPLDAKPEGPWRCGICFDDFPVGNRGWSLNCRHRFCEDCWRAHLSTLIESGTAGGGTCLDALCPEPGCGLRVGKNFFHDLLSPALWEKYKRALLLSFLEEGEMAVNCPASGCGCRVILGAARPDANCRQCGLRFCAKCLKSPHAPASCLDHESWAKLQAGSKQNVLQRWATRFQNFITPAADVGRPCPNPDCRVMSQRIDGCNYLRCPKCREDWCWNCGDWGGGPSGRPKPHHVFHCADLPKDPSWLEGHSSLAEDARMTWYKELWDSRNSIFQESTHLQERVLSTVDVGSQKVLADAAEAAVQARRVLRDGAVWRLFERNEGHLRLFEFAETELEGMTSRLSEGVAAILTPGVKEWKNSWRGTGYGVNTSREEQLRTLTDAVRTQTRGLCSFRHLDRGVGSVADDNRNLAKK